MKALEKDRDRRYESASALAADVRRHLNDEPVQAGPPSLGRRLRKFARRNRGRLAAAGALGFVLLVAGGAVGWAAWDRAARQARAANELELSLDRAELFQGQGKRAEALAAFERAESLTGQAPHDPARDGRLAALKERLAAEAQDQDFLARFEDARVRRASRLNVEDNNFDGESALPAIRDALRQYGIAVGETGPARVAARLEGRPEKVRREVLAALDECLRRPKREGAAQWLLAALESADSDLWRGRVRKALVERDEKALEQLARAAEVDKQPPSFLVLMARSLPAPKNSTPLQLLRRARRAAPADLWTNHDLGFLLLMNGRPAEAVRYFTAALALRPNNAGLYFNRGRALLAAGEADEAVADYRQALALSPRYAAARNNLGSALATLGRTDEAIAEFHEALRLKPDDALTHCNLGKALVSKGRPDDAIAEYRESLRLNSAYVEVHVILSNCLRRQGQFREALAEMRHAHELGSRRPYWPYPSAQWVRQSERLVELDERLPGFLAGTSTPAGPAEQVELAWLCSLKRLHGAAARFYAAAFAAQPKLAEELGPHRYTAARSAAQAGCGQGEDGAQFDGPERGRLRRQAREWLGAELAACGRLLNGGPDQARNAARVATMLQHWLADAGFEGVRGPESLAQLPEAERRPWQELWAGVADTLARAQAKTTPKEKPAAR